MKPRPVRLQDKQAGEAATLSVRIQPRSSKNEIVRQEGGFKIRLTAPPVDGAANDALIRFLSELLSIPKSRVEIVTGHTAKNKIVRINGVGQADVEQVLNQAGK